MTKQKNEPIEKQLWSSADKLRKNIDAAEYKHILLGLMFLKYISDSFEELYTKLKSGVGEYDGADPEDRDEYKAENVFFVPAIARWSFLKSRAKQHEIGKDVDNAMEAIEKDNSSLKGVLPKVYARGNLDPATLGGLIDLISNIALGDAKSRSADILGHVFEYFLGEFALAEADLQRLQEEAMQALRDGKLGEELDQIMQQLQDAMDRYMQALAERLEEMGLDQLPPMANLPEMQTQDIQDMMDRIQEMAETGNRDAAEQMLAEMQQMLDQLREGLQMQQSNPAMANARKMMDDLRSLTEDQQQLLDRTFEESQNERSGAFQRPRLVPGQPGQQQGQQPGQQQGQRQQGQQGQQPGQQQGQGPSAADQQALRQRLGELMMQMDEALGQIPENMGRAEQQMEQAGNNMGKGEMGDAANNQAQALEELRNATNQMAEAMAQQFGAQLGLGSGQPQRSGNQQGFDPFGRRNSNENGQGASAEDADVQLPDRMEILRAREILEELRKRSGERSRPKIELDYIDRLLDIF